MAIDTLLKDTKDRMHKSEEAFSRTLGRIRAGVANASLLDGITVEYYGVPTDLRQLATVTIPEARMLQISPYDKSSLNDIDRALQQSDLGIPPTNDGTVIRLIIPALTQERRKELTKTVGKDLEDAKIAIRNIRRDAIDEAKKAEKNKEITEDDVRTYESDIQDLTNASIKNVEALAAEKEKEIMNV
jgi:ribosome recycling factor